jgi:predicted ABC-type ATPase
MRRQPRECPPLRSSPGANGSGKSSLIRQVEFEGRENLLEPDAIAKRISPDSPQQGGISAGREVLIRAAEYIQSGQSFAIETTLSGNWINSTIREAMERSFLTRLFYI